MKILAFLKAHEINPGLVDEYIKLKKSGLDVIVVFDNKNSFFPHINNQITTFNTLGIDINFLLTDFDLYENSDLPGLYDYNDEKDFNRFMWYNADYSFYLVYKLLPDYDFYWQIEYDVYCNGNSYKHFFDEYLDNKDDLLVTRYSMSNNDWWAVEKTNWIWNDSYIRHCCILPIARLSNRAIKFLYDRRLQHYEIYKQKKRF